MVVEGNRRLAALMILLGRPEAEGLSLDVELDAKRLRSLQRVPCFEAPNRDNVHKFLGFRHIGGIKAWSAEARARYLLKEVEREKTADDPFVAVSRRVGIEKPAVRTAFLASAILRWGQRELGVDVAKMEAHDERRFGVWVRALQSPKIREYIGVGSPWTYAECEGALRRIRAERLREVVGHIAPAGDRSPVLDDSRNVTAYGRVLANEAARKVLRKTGSLEAARAIVDEAALPERVRRLAAKVDALGEEARRLDRTDDDLVQAVKELLGAAKALDGIVRSGS
ncbi:MAG: hypothetical protein HY744_15345 [Deltaproteobacteria bacterium]|nr:hypothetical protein [Deltaproteobacteria bacterium]